MELMGIVHDLLDRYHTVLGQTLVGILTETGAQMWLSQDYLWSFHVQFVARVGVPLPLKKKNHLRKHITIWLFNIAMGNGPFIDDFPIKTFIYKGFSMAMLNNQMVCSMYSIVCAIPLMEKI